MAIRKRFADEFKGTADLVEGAAHEDMDGLTVHSGTHYHLGEMVIVPNTEQKAVLTHE